MKTTTLILMIFILFGCGSTKQDWTTTVPTFEDFKTNRFCHITSAESRPKLLNTDFSISEKQEIAKAYLGVDNYANCEYSIASIVGRETDWLHIVINTQSGEIIGQLESTYGIIYAKQSALIISDPLDDNGGHSEMTKYWKIEDELKRIK